METPQQEIERLRAENAALKAAQSAKRSSAAKKAAATRKANRQAKRDALKRQVQAVVARHEGLHFMSGGQGVSCFVWVNGSICVSSNGLVESEAFRKEMDAIPGVSRWHVNLD